MLVQIDDGTWVNAGEIVSVTDYLAANLKDEGFQTAIQMKPEAYAIFSRWPISRIMEQLNGRGK